MIKLIDIDVWGRKFKLPIDYDCYEDETAQDNQIRALENFLAHPEWMVSSESMVKDYCQESVSADDENQKKDNIFSFIKPEGLFVKRNKESPQIALMCKYRYDIEHGLAIVFSDIGEVTVGSQDIIL